MPGVLSAELNFASATLLVQYDPAAEPLDDVLRTVRSTGHGIARLDEHGGHSEAVEASWIDSHLADIATAGSGVFSALGGVLAWRGAPEALVIVAFAVAIVFGGLLVWKRALLSLKVGVLDMNVLMSVAVFGAAALGEWGEGATVFFLFSLGGLLESRSLERTRRSIRDLMSLTPSTARVRRGTDLVQLETPDVAIGEVVIVRPGERVPLDGVVSLGESAVDESAITGESIPVDMTQGSRVFGGTLNTSGLLEVTVTANANDSTLARIVFMVEEAQASRAPSQSLIDRFSRVYTPVVIALAAVIAIAPPLIAPLLGMDAGPFSEWIRRSLVVLVVSCPCALVISTPVSIVSAITRASRDGVLVKGGAFLETAAKVRAVAVDKTGTLSEGRPDVGRVISLNAESPEHVLELAAALESHSNHPIAQAVVAAHGASAAAEVRGFSETSGRGVSGSIDGVVYEVCSPACAREQRVLDAEGEAAVAELEEHGMTVLVLLSGDEALGLVGVSDAVRPGVREALDGLRRGGVEHIVMLTGDNDRVAHAVAEQAGLAEYRARLLPQHKADAVTELKERFGTIAMVGDGINDAPALAVADIGIAMGAAGSDTALETADVALMRDDLSALAGFFALGRRTMRVIGENVAFSIGVKVVFLGLALVGKATLWMAVFADTGVSLLVILNGMRLLRRAR